MLAFSQYFSGEIWGSLNDVGVTCVPTEELHMCRRGVLIITGLKINAPVRND
jgi:hypothetical protein